jgi:hypothetical protein
MGMQATENGLRWGTRLLSMIYYLAVIPLIIDVFTFGAHVRSLYLFSYVLLSVAGLQIGYKESDGWVRIWFWINLAYETMIAGFAFFWPAFSGFASLAPWEKWLHLALLLVALVFLGLNRLVPPAPMKPVTAEEDIEAGLPPVPNQTPA